MTERDDAPAGLDALRELVAVMDRLRSPGGCPWDAEQTHASLVQYLVEETYEVIDAIDAEDSEALREELGDLLLQVVFHARIAQEEPGGFDIDDVATGIAEKLVRRHPHVFAGAQVADAADSEAAWFALKVAEKGRTSVTDGVPAALPALALTAKLRHRALKGGVAVEPGSLPAREAAAAALAAVGDSPEALGELIVALVGLGDARGWDVDAAARAAARGYRDELVAAEREAGGSVEPGDAGGAADVAGEVGAG